MSSILSYRFPYESCPIEIISLALACPDYEFNAQNVQWNEFDERFYVTLWRLIDSIDMRLKQHSDEWVRALCHRNSSGFMRSRNISAYSRERFSTLSAVDIQRLRRNGSVRQLNNLTGVHATFEGFAMTQSTM